MNEQTPGNPFQSEVFELNNSTIFNTSAQGKPLFRFNDQYLVYQIRRGGMGEVFLCRPVSAQGPYPFALKSFQKRFFFDPAIRDAFLREVHTWSRLSGLPYIMPILGLEYYDDRPFVKMVGIEPSPSGVVTVRDVLNQHQGSLSSHLMFRYAYQVATGMTFVEEEIGNIIHGDLKPENLLLLLDGLFISDFGLARVIGEGTQTEYPLESTWAYRAPECWEPSRVVSQSSDIYAFGIILYELLTGEYPFRAKTREEWSNAHQTLHPSVASGFSQDDASIICMELALWCLAKDRAVRPQSFAQIMRELAQIGLRYFPEMYDHVQKSINIYLQNIDSIHDATKKYAIEALIASGQYQAALVELERIPREAFNSTLWYLLGRTLSLNEKENEAVSAFIEALHLNPEDSSMIYFDLALSFKHLGRYQDAITIYETLLRQVDDELVLPIKVNLATIYITMSQPKEAVALLESLASSGTRIPEVWANLGDAYRMLERQDDAVKCYQQALTYATHKTEVQMHIASVLMDHLGCVNEALEILDIIAAQQGQKSYEWAVRSFACHLALGHKEYVTRQYHKLLDQGWPQVEIDVLQEKVNEFADRARNLQNKQESTSQSPVQDKIIATDTRTTESSGSSHTSQYTQETLSNDISSRDDRQETATFSLPFINLRFYMVDSVHEYSVDFYDDVNDPQYIDRLMAAWRSTTRNLAIQFDSRTGSHPILRQNMFYFTVCLGCDMTILTNRDLGKRLNCRRCSTDHYTAQDNRHDYSQLLARIYEKLGLDPLSMNGVLQLLLIQCDNTSDVLRIETICTEEGFNRVPEESFVTTYMFDQGRQRRILADDLPFSVWRKIAEGGERAGMDGSSSEVEAVRRKIRAVTPALRFTSICVVVDPKDKKYGDSGDTDIMNLLLQDKLDQAEDALQAKLLKGEDIVDTLELLVKLFIFQKRYPEAREKVMALIQFRPDHEKGWSLLADIEIECQNYQEAIASLERARSINPVNEQTLRYIANCYYLLGEANKARSYAVQARSLGGPSIPALDLQEALEAYLQAGDLSAARRAIETHQIQLFQPEAEQILEGLIEIARTEGDQTKVGFFENKLTLLRNCKSRGTTSIFEELEKGR